MDTNLRDRVSDREDARVPRRVSWEIKDLLDPITLHRKTLWIGGSLMLALILTGVVGWFFFFAPPSGSTLLAQAVEAAGGMKAWNAIDDGSFTRIHTVYDESGNVERTESETFYFRKTGDWRLLIEAETSLGRVVIGNDDEGYWATKDGDPISPVIVARSLGMMCESEYCTPQCAAEMAFFRFSLPFKLTDPGVHPRNVGSATLNGHPVWLLEATYDPEIGSDRWVFYVDEKSKLIRKIEHYPSLDTDAAPEEIFWSDHQSVEGITFSHRRSYYRSNGTKLEEYVIEDADFNLSLADETFVRPEKRSVRPAALSL